MSLQDMSFFVARVNARVHELQVANRDEWKDATSLSHPPVPEAIAAAAERRLGFALPATLRTLYTRLGNGGYGPAYGLLGLSGGAVQEDRLDAVGVYERSREADPRDLHWQWPEKLLPVVHLGCAMFLCVDCSDDRGMVVWFEPNPHEDGKSWDDAFYPLGIAFEELMFRWAAGEDVLARMDAAFQVKNPSSNEHDEA